MKRAKKRVCARGKEADVLAKKTWCRGNLIGYARKNLHEKRRIGRHPKNSSL